MHPILFVLGPITIYSFGFALAVAFLVCAFLMSRDARRLNISSDVIYDFVFWSALAGILGARLFYILLNWDFFSQNPGEFFQIQHGGLAWQGGLIVGIPSAIFYLKNKKLPVLPMLDLASPYAALGQAIGRIGCFLNGCCYGQPAAWGPYCPVHQDHLHPTQLYESFGLLIVFFVLKNLSRKKYSPGSLVVTYLMSAAAIRFVVQFFRYDYDPVLLGLGLFQWICVGVFVSVVFLLNYLKKQNGLAR